MKNPETWQELFLADPPLKSANPLKGEKMMAAALNIFREKASIFRIIEKIFPYGNNILII